MLKFEPISKYSHGDILKWKNTNIKSLYIKIEKNNVFFEELGINFIDRMQSLQKMIRDTLLIYEINDLEIILNVTDNPYNNPFIPHFSKTDQCPINVIPFFSFYNWDVAKSDDYFNTKQQILDNVIEWKNKEDIIMWSGTNSSKIRTKMNEIKHLEGYISKTITLHYFYNLITNYNANHTFISLEDHAKYKYLLDMEGVGYSGRFPYLSLTGSCIIILENINNQFRYHYDTIFVENVHYLKVQYDENELSTMEVIHDRIIDKIKMFNCEEIGKNCKSLAIETFTKDKILEYFKDVLSYYSTFYVKENIQYNPSLEYTHKNIDKKKLFQLIKK
jgi:hypothetical protein